MNQKSKRMTNLDQGSWPYPRDRTNHMSLHSNTNIRSLYTPGISPNKSLNNISPYLSQDGNGTYDGISNGLRVDNTHPHFVANSSCWKVVNYQIPVPIGDCSAHFLVDEETGAVERAFLMDGGTNTGIYAAWAQILKGLRFIDLQIGNDWRFDTWVVTHWDADHYDGVKDLLASEDIKIMRCSRGGGAITKSSPESFASNYFNSDAVLCCGAWDTKVIFKGGGDFLHPFVQKNQVAQYDEIKTARERIHEGKWPLRCIWGEKLIGLDLFTRSRQFNGKTGEVYQSRPSKDAQDDFCKPLPFEKDAGASQKPPRFCVVGANGYGIGKPTAVKNKPSRNETSILALLYWPNQKFCSYYTGGDGHPDVVSDPVRKWFQHVWPGGNVEMIKLDHHGSTRENLGEVHRTEDKGKNEGMAEERSEEEKPSKPEAELEEEEPKTSEDSKWNDLQLGETNAIEQAKKNTGIVLEYMKPRRILVTPGSLHGHPTWDVLLVLKSYFEALSRVGNQGSAGETAKALFTTRSVYWFTKDSISAKDINFKHIYGTVMQNRLRNATGDGSGMLEEKVKQAPNDINEEYPSDEQEDDAGDPSVNFEELRLNDAPDKVDAQKNFYKWRARYIKYLLEQDEKKTLSNGKAKLFTKTGNVNYVAINRAVMEAVEAHDKERRKEAILEEDKGAPNPGSEEHILDELLRAYDEFVHATDDAQLEGEDDFENICWQPLGAFENENPHFLIRFEFGYQKEDTILEVFDDSGKCQYIKGKKKGKWVKTLLLSEDKQKPWTKHAYGECDIATILSSESLGNKLVYTYYSKRPGAKDRIKKIIGSGELDDSNNR